MLFCLDELSLERLRPKMDQGRIMLETNAHLPPLRRVIARAPIDFLLTYA